MGVGIVVEKNHLLASNPGCFIQMTSFTHLLYSNGLHSLLSSMSWNAINSAFFPQTAWSWISILCSMWCVSTPLMLHLMLVWSDELVFHHLWWHNHGTLGMRDRGCGICQNHAWSLQVDIVYWLMSCAVSGYHCPLIQCSTPSTMCWDIIVCQKTGCWSSWSAEQKALQWDCHTHTHLRHYS